jgi:hypothetical protein
VAYLLKARTVEPMKQPLLGNGLRTRFKGVTVGSGFLYSPYRSYTTRTCCHYGGVLGRQLEELEFGVRWWPVCEDVNQLAENHPLFEEVSKQSSKEHD